MAKIMIITAGLFYLRYENLLPTNKYREMLHEKKYMIQTGKPTLPLHHKMSR